MKTRWSIVHTNIQQRHLCATKICLLILTANLVSFVQLRLLSSQPKVFKFTSSCQIDSKRRSIEMVSLNDAAVSFNYKLIVWNMFILFYSIMPNNIQLFLNNIWMNVDNVSNNLMLLFVIEFVFIGKHKDIFWGKRQIKLYERDFCLTNFALICAYLFCIGRSNCSTSTSSSCWWCCYFVTTVINTFFWKIIIITQSCWIDKSCSLQ